MKLLEDKYIVVIGAARSGVAAAILLQAKGAKVFVSDLGSISEDAKIKMQEAAIPYEENGHSEKARSGDLIVLSPGVPTESEIVQLYLNNGKSVFSEIEVASWFTKNNIIAITGSNGKTTVTSWLGHVWKTAGLEYTLGGNIGFAFSDKVEGAKGEFILEVSSFQLDHIQSFKPAVSIILNITPDHMDRYHNSMEKYAASKFKITENQKEQDVFIYHYDDPVLSKFAAALKEKEDAPRIWSFSSKTEVPEGAFVRDNDILFKFNNKVEFFMHMNDIGLKGRHNLNNGMATALAARAAEIKNDAIRESLQSFEGVEHRLELVRVLDGVKYINDSKATNVNAVWFALDSFNTAMTLILGGRDKGNDYSELESQIREKVHTIIAIGESKQRIQDQLGKVVPDLVMAEDMNEAVGHAHKIAKRGEVVLLSPACSSFDMYENFEHRGTVFKQEVMNLT